MSGFGDDFLECGYVFLVDTAQICSLRAGVGYDVGLELS